MKIIFKLILTIESIDVYLLRFYIACDHKKYIKKKP